MKIKKGYTLIESLIAITLISFSATTIMGYGIEKINELKIKKIGSEMNELLKGIDVRLFIDGYNSNYWEQKSWNKKSNIDDLIQKELQGINSICKTGTWKPLNKEFDLSLVDCELLKNNKFNININFILKDKKIKDVNMGYSFENDKLFEQYFKDYKFAFDYAIINKPFLKSGYSSYGYKNKKTNKEIDLMTCTKLKSDCSFNITLEKKSKSELLMKNGNNSIVNAEITFKYDKFKEKELCKYLKNENGNWVNKEKECGIGLNDNSISVTTKSGTFKKVLLTEKCKTFKSINGKIVDTGILVPCGYMTDEQTGKTIQLVNDIHTNEIFVVELNIEKIKGKQLKTNEIIAKEINISDILTTNSLMTNQIESFELLITDGGFINDLIISKDFELEELINKKTLFEQLTIEKDLISNELNTELLKSNNVIIKNTVITKQTNSYKTEANFGDFKNINNKLNELKIKIKDQENQLNNFK